MLAAGKSRVSVPGHRAVTGPPDRQATRPSRRLQTVIIIESAVTVLGRMHPAEALTRASAGSPSQIDFTLDCRGPGIRANDHRV